MKKLQLLLMAAGESSRFGSPKQLASLGCDTLIQHQLKLFHALQKAAYRQKVELQLNLVVGANSEQILHHIDPSESRFQCWINTDWAEGLGGSIRFACQKALNSPAKADGVWVCLLDQCLLTQQEYLALLLSFLREPDKICCADYKGKLGVPAIFPPSRFPELLSLKGDKGAKELLNPIETRPVAMPQAAFDLDKQEQLIQIKQQLNQISSL